MHEHTSDEARNIIPATARARGEPVRKHAKALPKNSVGAVALQSVRCGKPTCRCASGTLHGPYAYLFWREGGRLRKRYLPADEVAGVRAACAARRAHEAARRAALETSRAHWCALVARLKEVTSDA